MHGTGGLYDTVQPMTIDQSEGNGFRFDHYSADDFRWAIDQAMEFFGLEGEVRDAQIRRVMQDSAKRFSHKEVARRYIEIYEQMLERPLVEKSAGESMKPKKNSRAAKKSRD